MSLHLDCPSQRWLALCDVHNCGNKILASEGTHAEQQAELAQLVDAAGWRYAADIGHYCAGHAVQLAPAIPRESHCRRDAWCMAADGHGGQCVTAAKRHIPPTDFGPAAAKRRRY